MVKIFIPFNDWSRDKLHRGMKTATCRSKPYGKVNDIFEIFLENRPRGQRVVSYIVTSITKKSLKNVSENHFAEEGAESPEEFIAVWNDIHPRRKFRPNDIKWFHTFKEV